MHILITGGAGFIGSHLALALDGAGHDVTVLDALSAQIHGAEPRHTSPSFARIDGQVRFIHGSVTDAAALRHALQGQDAVVHLAAETGTGQSMYEIARYVDVNVGGTALLLDLLANQPHTVRKLVVASSRALYGEGRYLRADGTPVYPKARRADDLASGRFELHDAHDGSALTPTATDENASLHPSSVYGITKHTQEQLVMTACPTLGIAGTALRYQNVYGPGQSLANPYTGILSIFSTRILHRKPIAVFEDGRESRDFVYIDDVVRATTLALFDARSDGQVFGIGSGVATSVQHAAETLVAAFGLPTDIRVTGAWRAGDIRHNWADLTKPRALLDYEPQIDFPSGIARFVAWVQSQPLHPDKLDQSLLELQKKGLLRG